jgi:hypothetical protein
MRSKKGKIRMGKRRKMTIRSRSKKEGKECEEEARKKED